MKSIRRPSSVSAAWAPVLAGAGVVVLAVQAYGALADVDAPIASPPTSDAAATVTTPAAATPATTVTATGEESPFDAPQAPATTADAPTPPATSAQAPTGGADGGAAPAPDADAPRVRWQGTLRDGYTLLREHAAKDQHESARALADALLAPSDFLRAKADFAARGGWRARLVRTTDPVLDWCGWNGPSPEARAEILYARGVVGLLAKDRTGAEDDFHRARAATRSRLVQHDALYDVGWLALDAAEAARAQLPEISGKPPAPPPAPPTGAAAGTPPPPDPLQVARAAYLEARERFVERLRADWRDEDTQANVELCLKRLRELDAIEKKRQEEKQKQEQQQKQDSKDSKSQPDKDESKPEDDPSKKPKDGDEKQPPKPEDADPKQDPKDERPPEPKSEDEAAKKPETPRPTEADPAQMSREEVTQLLDRLQKLEEEAKRIQAALKAARRAKVKKDW